MVPEKLPRSPKPVQISDSQTSSKDAAENPAAAMRQCSKSLGGQRTRTDYTLVTYEKLYLQAIAVVLEEDDTVGEKRNGYQEVEVLGSPLC